MQTIESLTKLLRMAHEQIETEVAKNAELDKECLNAKNYMVDLSKTIVNYSSQIAELEATIEDLNYTLKSYEQA